MSRKTRDPVADQLRDIARQGAGMAHIAHTFAVVLLVLFSLASFVALAGDAFTKLLTDYHAGTVNVPAAISVLVSILIVPSMDAAMFYAASLVRIMATRRVARSEMLIHLVVIAVTALVEGAAYIYMSALYEHPTTPAAWGIISVRGLTAPLLAVYLSMARPLPVTERDILYQVEFASGAGVIRDVVRLANDPDAPLARKLALYRASAQMSAEDGARLDAMIAVLDTEGRRIVEADTSPDGGDTPPGGLETPLHLVPAQARPRFTARELSSERKRLEEDARRDKAFRFLDAHPRATGNQLRQVLGCNRSVAGTLHREWREAQLEEAPEEAIDA